MADSRIQNPLVLGLAGLGDLVAGIALSVFGVVKDNQVLAIGVTSYCGMLYFGINADRDAMSDVDVLPTLLAESLEELLEAARQT